MHDLGELILEGVANSFEAGADETVILVRKKDGFVSVRIQDNGKLVSSAKYFEDGFSTKGIERGRGLALIKLVDNGAKLFKEGEFTILSFCSKDDGSLKNIEDVLFPIFQYGMKIDFIYYMDNKEVLHISKEKEKKLETIKEIAYFKQMIRLGKGVYNV